MTDLFQPQTTPKRKRNPLPKSAPCLSANSNTSASASIDSTFTFELPTRSLQRPAPPNSDETEDAPPASQSAASEVVHRFRGLVVLDRTSGSSSSSRGSGSAKCGGGGGVRTGRPREPTRQARKRKDQPPQPQGQGQGSNLSRRDKSAVETKGETPDGKFSEGEEECGEDDDDLRKSDHEDNEDTLAGRKRQKLNEVSAPAMDAVMAPTTQGGRSTFVPNRDDDSKIILPKPAQVTAAARPTEPPPPTRNNNTDESKRAASRKQRRKKTAPDKKKKKKKKEVKAKEPEEEKEEPEIVEPIRASLTWREEEITVYDPEDKDDDGTGINGVGFQPTPELAHAIALKKRQQLMAYKKMIEGDARARRNERRRGNAAAAAAAAAVANQSPRRRRVRFMSPEDEGCSP